MAADNLNIQISARTKEAIDHINELIGALSSLNGALGNINTSGLDNVTGSLQGMNNALGSIQSTVNTVSTLNRELAGTGQAAAPLTEAANGLQEISANSEAAASSVRDISTTASGQGTNGLQTMAQAAENTNQALQRVAPAAERASRSMRNMSGSSFGAALSSKGLVKELTRIGKMLKLMVTRMVLRKVIQGVVDGFKGLVQYSKTFDASVSLLWNSFRQLGNSIAAAVSPLLNALAPALNYVIQLIIKAVNVINQLISALTGMATWTRAKVLTDDYAKSLDKANGSAKALKKTVLGFDELNQLQDNNGGGGGSNAADMFEQVAIDPKILGILDAIKKKVNDVLNRLKELWASFKDGFKNALGGDWKSKVASILDGAKRIKNALVDIFTDSRVVSAMERYYQSLAKTLGTIAGTITRIGLNIGVNLAQGIAASLEKKAPRIKDYLVNLYDVGTAMNKQVENVSLALGEISDVIAGENGIAVTTNLSNIFLEAFMLISENAAKLGQSILELITQPIIDNKDSIAASFDGVLGTFASVTSTIDTAISDIRDTFGDAWDNNIYPIISEVKTALSDLTDIVLEFWNETIQPFLDDIAAEFGDVWGQDLSPLFKDVINIIGIIGEYLAHLYKNNFVPLVRFLKDVLTPIVKASLDAAVAGFKYAWNIISGVVGGVTKTLSALLTFIKTGFTVGWKQAWEGLKNDFSQILDFMLQKFKNIINAIADGINAFIGAYVGTIDAVISKMNKLPNVNISLIGDNFLKIPHWATGGFPEDGLFMANHNELVGRFSNGRTAVANNEQITAGIAQAVYSAMMASNSGGSQYINNTIEVDGVAIARAVTKGQRSLDRRYSPTMA